MKNKHTAMNRFSEMTNWTIERAITIQQIPAPTFQEERRAAYIMQVFKALGLELVETDDVFNVYGLLPGQNRKQPGLMIVAHTDTVFPQDTDLTIRREERVIYGPGLGDNSIGVAGMLCLVEMLKRDGVTLPCNMWFVATSREEGLGDLGGMKAAFQRLQPQVKAVINLEGLAFGHIYHAGIAVRRLHISANAEGGHSWLHFGRASAIHGIVQLGSRLTSIQTTRNPRTTYNIGMIDGGHSINSIATEASLWLDMRSETRAGLEQLEQQVNTQIDTLRSRDLHLSTKVVGDRPAGAIPPDHPLVQMALDALEKVGVRGALETGSTDGNVPLSYGCPTVTIGITRGGNAHRLDEYVEIEPIASGLQQFYTLTLAASQWQV